MFALTEKVCDDLAHCEDNSDEQNCDRVLIGKNYEKHHPPIPNCICHFDDLKKHYLKVYTNITILDIIDISQDPGMVKIFMRLTLEWYDDHLNYSFLNDETYLNTINSTTEKNMWVPSIGFTYDESQQNIEYRSLKIVKKDRPILTGDISEISPLGKLSKINLLTRPSHFHLPIEIIYVI